MCYIANEFSFDENITGKRNFLFLNAFTITQRSMFLHWYKNLGNMFFK